MGYQEFKQLKSKNRATYFKCDKRKRVEPLNGDVTVKVSIMKFNGLELKAQRGKFLPLVVNKSCGSQELFCAEYEKLEPHDKGEIKTFEDYVAFYPDATKVTFFESQTNNLHYKSTKRSMESFSAK